MMRLAIQIGSVFTACVFLASCATTGTINQSQYSYLLEKSPNVELHRLYAALPKYQALEGEPWPYIASNHKIKPGDNSLAVKQIRERLIKLGDLSSAYENQSGRYGLIMEHAIMHFQRRHGLKADGVIGPDTLKALNVTPAQRVSEMINSMKGWAELPSDSNEEYIQVNIPSYELNVVRGNMSMLKMRVVVGKPSWPTPTLQSKITTLVLNPSWNVPTNIIEREIVHHMVRNPKYLEEERIRIFQDWKRDAREIHPTEITWTDYTGDKALPYRFTQLPGRDNVLGDVKFLFPNSHSVYLHDTQAKSLFARDRRDFSHGCVRLGQPMALFDYLMRERSKIGPEQALMHLGEKESKYFAIKPIPIYITYMTAWVSPNGDVQFRPNIYNKPGF